MEKSKELSSPRSQSPAGGEDEFVRLHITPLDTDLLKIVVPSAVLPTARSISFHTIETFPEKRFGYLELPRIEAEKLKKKLNGATLKGSKMRIEKARPEKKRQITEEDQPMKKKKTKRPAENEEVSEKKHKRDAIDGMVLHDRKVKRGWTEPLDYKKTKKDKEAKKKDKDDKRTQTRSKYTEKEECLLKTKLPPNVASTLPKKEEDDSTKKRKKKNKTSREVTVHEFENTTKFPSFLRDSAPTTNGKGSAEFVEGKGWVDDEGNVVEELREKAKPKPAPKPKKAKTIIEESSDDSTSSSESSSESDSSSDSSSEEESDDEMVDVLKSVPSVEKTPRKPAQDHASKAKASSSESSSDSSSDSSASSSDSDSDSDAEVSTAPAKGLTINIPPPPATPSTKAVHPLEALYKPSAADEASGSTSAAPAAEPFSFFGGDGGDGDDDDIDDEAEGKRRPTSIAMPMTPYTRQDFEWRNIRSAAPTPDTAHPPRTQPLWAGQDQDDEMEDEEIEEAYNSGAATPGQGTSDFQKWFWENRGDLNRSWMTRRKTAAKEKRHRDNKTRASKAV